MENFFLELEEKEEAAYRLPNPQPKEWWAAKPFPDGGKVSMPTKGSMPSTAGKHEAVSQSKQEGRLCDVISQSREGNRLCETVS